MTDKDQCDCCLNWFDPCCGYIEDGGFICDSCMRADDPDRKAVWNEQEGHEP